MHSHVHSKIPYVEYVVLSYKIVNEILNFVRKDSFQKCQRKLNGKMFWSEFWTNQFKYENMDVTVFPHFNYGLTFRPWS